MPDSTHSSWCVVRPKWMRRSLSDWYFSLESRNRFERSHTSMAAAITSRHSTLGRGTDDKRANGSFPCRASELLGEVVLEPPEHVQGQERQRDGRDRDHPDVRGVP